MKIDYLDKKMIITHESGVVTVYTKSDIENYRDKLQERTAKLLDKVTDCNLQIAEIENS